MSLSLGARLGPYEITGALGAGGVGEVWRATDTRLKREVAIKILPADFARDADRLARFEREAQLLAQLYPARMMGFSLDSAQDGRDAYVVALAEDGTLAGKPIRVAGGGGDQDSPTVSADGALVAYESSESGRPEIYVARLADPGSKRRVTNDSGWSPLWSRDGKRLLYLSENRVFSVALRSASDLRFDEPQAVTALNVPGTINSFDVSADGTSVLVGRVADPLMLRRDIRLWPAWGKTLPPVQ